MSRATQANQLDRYVRGGEAGGDADPQECGAYGRSQDQGLAQRIRT